MPDPETIREEKVLRAIQALKGKSEEEREELIDILDLTPAEKERVRSQLWAPPPRPPVRPEALRETETFQRLVEDVRRGKGVLFVGAGVSQDVGMPSSSALVDALKALARSYGVSIDEERRYTFPDIAGLLERAGLRNEVVETLKDRIDEAYRQDPPPHRQGFYHLLPYLGELNELILTTNWDNLSEKALREAGEAVVRVLRDRELPTVAAADHAVIKLHGDFTDPDTLVVSDNDYERARNAIARPGGLAGSLWGMVSSLLAQKSRIFVGYRMADEDMNLLRSLVAARQMGTRVRNYMIGPFDESERQGLKDWLQMEVISAKASEFFVALAQELAEFANRRDDLDRIFRREASPFLEFYAPFGAGKHTLLDEIERRAKGEGWRDEQTIRVDLRQEPRPSTAAGLTECIARAMGKPWIRQGEKLGQALRDKRRLLVLFEHTEAAEEDWDEFTSFVSRVVGQAVKDLDDRGQRSKLILSGRYPVKDWPFYFKRHAEVFPLSPFTLSAVREMVGKYTLFRDPRAAIDRPTPRLVEQIYNLTGRSHPGFIKEILDDLMEKSQKPEGRIKLPPALTEQEKEEYLASFAETIHEELWLDAPPELEALFAQGLCVLRRLNAGLLARLAEKDVFRALFNAVGEPEDVLNSLRRCHLLTYKFPLEVIDLVTRRIQSHILQRSEPERFALVHRAAASAWKDLLPIVEDLTQLQYYREWLYHMASYLRLDAGPEESHWDVVREQVKAIQFRSTQPYLARMGATLLDDIEMKKERDRERDEELLNVLLDCLGEAYYEKFRQLLMTKSETC